MLLRLDHCHTVILLLERRKSLESDGHIKISLSSLELPIANNLILISSGTQQSKADLQPVSTVAKLKSQSPLRTAYFYPEICSLMQRIKQIKHRRW